MSGTPQDVGGEAAVRPDTQAPSEVAKPETEVVKTEAEGEGEPQETQEQADQREKKKREGGFQRKIRRLESEFGSVVAERDKYKALAEAPSFQRQADNNQEDSPKPPRLDDFKSYEDYEAAKERYVADKTRRETLKVLEAERTKAEAKKAEAEQRERITKARERFESDAEKVAEHYEDFDEVMDDFFRGRSPLKDFDRQAHEFIFEDAKRAPELVYHLHQNDDVAKRIAAMRPVQQVAELARLEASLAKPTAKTVSKAPPPPRTVGAKGGPDGKDPEKMSIEEMRKASGTRPKVVSK